MKIIRDSVFETNSSSSHSLVIRTRKELKGGDLPRNKDHYSLNEYGVASCSEDSVSINKLYTEIEKASYCVNVCTTICDYLWNENKMFTNYDWNSSIEDSSYMDQFWEEMINSDVFKTLVDVIYEETGTKAHYAKPGSDFIPFYDCIYLEDNDVPDMFHFDSEDLSEFKEYLRKVIFDKNIIIVDAEIPYGIEGIDL